MDDDEDWRGVLEDLLVAEGAIVATAGDGRAAFQSICGSRPELIITDVEMPVMDGGELLAKVRGLEGDLPVIVMTGEDAPSDAMSVHAFCVLRKPATTDAVLAAVREALLRRGQTRFGRLWSTARAAAMPRASRRRRLALMTGVGAAAAAAILIVTIRVASGSA